MSHAIAAVGRPVISHTTHAVSPLVLVEGAPDPDLQVLRFESALPADTRTAELQAIDGDACPGDRLHGRTVTVAVPHALSDGGSRWRVLLSGRVSEAGDRAASGVQREVLKLDDGLADALARPADTLGACPDDGLSLREIITRLGVLLRADTVFVCDPGLIDGIATTEPAQDKQLGSVLTPLLESAGLVILQSLSLERERVARTLTVMPERSGRRVALPWPDDQGRGGSVLSVETGSEQAAPRAWVALGQRPVVEDTFTLVPGWDPALGGQPDADYARLTSSDFSRFGSVYRAWVLNEDGAFSAAPFNAGPAFDAGALFGVPGTVTEPLRFGDCLTRDASGRFIAPVIESSTDSGGTWSAYPGLAEVMRDRAGVRLTDDTLPDSILSAAKAGTLRLRVTAALSSPDPIRARRWDGNPFAGAGSARLLRFGDRFRWRRVASTSIHAPSIASGELSADTADDRAALRLALLQRVAASPGASASATAELAGAWIAINAGDRVRDVQAPGVTIDGGSSHIDPRDAQVRDITITFGVGRASPRTRLVLS